MTETSECPSTMNGGGRTKIACGLPGGHEGRHKGAGAYWWHGNGETCPGCARVAALAALAAQPSPASPDTEGGADRG